MKIFNTLKNKFYPALFYSGIILARGGGGGSGGSGGGGGGGHSGGFSSHSYSSGSSSSGNAGPLPLIVFGIIFVVFIIGSIYKNKIRKYFYKLYTKKQEEIIQKDRLDWPELKKEFTEIFLNFQNAWTNFDLSEMEKLLAPEYFKRLVLELNVLKNQKRQNLMSNLKIDEMFLVGEEEPGERMQKLVIRIMASANDILMDTENNKPIFADGSEFTEYWHFVQLEGKWKLELITQETADQNSVEPEIQNFAKVNNFYFDPDFGWLMMPNKGVIFNKTNFGYSDINNHVIGYFRDKIVEFYTYIPNSNSRLPENYLVAQAILPKSYFDILIKKKKWLQFGPWGLKKVSLESTDFNSKFSVWADPQDQVNSLELLTPNFMEKIYNLPFQLNIELVGNFLYFYTKNRGSETYPQMLEIISWAFDEMKM